MPWSDPIFISWWSKFRASWWNIESETFITSDKWREREWTYSMYKGKYMWNENNKLESGVKKKNIGTNWRD